MATSTATVQTAHASRYLQQLCKHWGHKFEVTFTPAHGEIQLPLGSCILDADAEALRLRLEAGDETVDQAKFEQIVEEHLQRFAFREALQFQWSRPPQDGAPHAAPGS
jgi:hypothetical protein